MLIDTILIENLKKTRWRLKNILHKFPPETVSRKLVRIL